MSTKRSVILRGAPEIDDQGVAAGAISPGYLVKCPASGVVVQSVSNAKVPAVVALEREQFGAGIDDTYQGASTIDAAYASGDQVRVAWLQPGNVVTMYIASGQNIQKDEFLGSAGNGTLKSVAATDAIGVSEEEVGAVTVLTAIKVRIV